MDFFPFRSIASPSLFPDSRILHPASLSLSPSHPSIVSLRSSGFTGSQTISCPRSFPLRFCLSLASPSSFPLLFIDSPRNPLHPFSLHLSLSYSLTHFRTSDCYLMLPPLACCDCPGQGFLPLNHSSTRSRHTCSQLLSFSSRRPPQGDKRAS